MKTGKRNNKRKNARWISRCFLAILLITLMVVTTVSGSRQEEDDVILKVNGQSVHANEALVYWKLVKKSFVRIGSDRVWDLDMMGMDARQTAVDRTLASIIRVKTAQEDVGEVTETDVVRIEQTVDKLQQDLGTIYMQKNGIDRSLLETVITENYLVSRYEENANFRTSDFDEEISQNLEDKFGAYDGYDKEEYLKTAIIRPLMFYTGQWSDDTWTSYPDAQKEQIYNKVLALRQRLDTDNFSTLGAQADETTVENDPALTEGAVTSDYMQYGDVYKGQMDPQAAEVIFSTKIGEITPVIETSYGYMIAYVTGFREPGSDDLITYKRQLKQARYRYRLDLLDSLKEQRLEEEWERLENEADIESYPDKLSRYIKDAE